MLAFDHLLKKEQQEKQQKLQKQQNEIQQNVISNNVGLVQVGTNAVSTSASSNTSNSNSISTSNTSAISTSALNIQGVGAGRVDVISTVGSITVNNASNNENNNGINAPYSTVTDSQQNQIVSAIQVKYQDIAYYLSLLEHEIARHQELGDKQREEEKSIATLEEKQAKKNQEQLDKQYIDAKNELKTEREKNVNQAATRLASAMSSTQSVAQSLEDGNRDVPLYTSIPNSSHNIAIQTGPVGPVVGHNGEVLSDTSNQAKELIKNNISNQQDNQWLGKVGTGEVGHQNVSIDVNVNVNANANAGVQATTQGQFGSHDVAPQNVQVTNPTSPTLQPNNQQRVTKSNDHFVNQQGVMYQNTSNQGVQQIGVNSVDTRAVRTNGAYTNNTNNSNNQITGNRGYQDTQGGIPFDDVPFPIEQMVNTQGASRQFASTNGSSFNGTSKQYVGGANTTSSNVGGYEEYDSGYSDVADIASGGGDYIAPTSFSEESDNESDLENSYTYTDRNISAELGNWALHNNVVKPSNEVVISNKRILDESDFIGLIDDSYLKDVFKANVDKSYHTMLVKGERLETSDENTWNLRVPNEFKFWIDEKNICKVEEAVSKGLGRTIKINIDFVEDSNLSRCPSSLISSYFNHRLKLKKQELQSNQTFSVIANKMRINLDNSYYCFTEARELKN